MCFFLSVIFLLGALTAYVDPFFHYHAPSKNIEYQISNQRYQNDGILRNFEYNAVITGSSMTQNFKTSEFDALFGTSSVKVPFSGAYFKEIHDRLDTAFSSQNKIDYVVLSLDFFALSADKDAISTYDYPEYLYDADPFNDSLYLFNKTVLVDYVIGNIKYTLAGNKTTTFDDYMRNSEKYEYSKSAVLSKYQRPAMSEKGSVLSEKKLRAVQENIEQNLISLALEHPETEFYCFFPPYSICQLDSWNRQSYFVYGFGMISEAARLLLECENIHLFSFYDCYDIICDLDNYRDRTHYAGWVNSYILECMKSGEHQLTSDNYAAHFESVCNFYSDYNYDSIFG